MKDYKQHKLHKRINVEMSELVTWLIFVGILAILLAHLFIGDQ